MLRAFVRNTYRNGQAGFGIQLMQYTATIRRMKAAGAPPRLSGFGTWADRHFKWLLVAPAVLLILAL